MHDHDHADVHASFHGGGASKALRRAVLATAVFAVVEAVGGWLAGSLALLADAGHMITDVAALLVALFAARISEREPTQRMSYGFRRAETLGAVVNALFMVVIAIFIVVEAAERFLAPRSVDGALVVVIGAVGLVVNVVVFRFLHGDAESLNVRGALLHVIGDMLGSVAAIASGIVILTTGWSMVDPLLSLLIAGIITFGAVRILREATLVLMEATPTHQDPEEIAARLLKVDGVLEVHDLHVWSLGRETALSAHLRMRDLKRWPAIMAECTQLARVEFRIAHCTFQPELPGETVLVPVADIPRRKHPDRLSDR